MDDICHKKKSFTELNHKMTNEEDNILEWKDAFIYFAL